MQFVSLDWFRYHFLIVVILYHMNHLLKEYLLAKGTIERNSESMCFSHVNLFTSCNSENTKDISKTKENTCDICLILIRVVSELGNITHEEHKVGVEIGCKR